MAGVLPAAALADKGPMLATDWIPETQQIHPALGAGLSPGLVGDPSPQGRGRVGGRRSWRRDRSTGLGLDGQLDGMAEPTHLDLDLQGEPAVEPVGVQQQQQPRGDRDHPQLCPQSRGGGGVDRVVL
jgi:hypothetical protein